MTIPSRNNAGSRNLIADAVRTVKPRVMERWESEVREKLAGTEHRDRFTLRDALPQFIDRLVLILAGSSAPDADATGEVGQAHGEQRSELKDYSLEEVLLEYSILRQAIFGELEATRKIENHERDLILESFDKVIREATTEFVRRQYEKIRAEQARSEGLLEDQETRDQFVAILTHDLKNPLTAIRLSAELLKTKFNPDHCLLIADKILVAVDRSELMIRDLLDVSKVRSGQPLSLRFEICDPVAIARVIIADLSLIYKNSFVVSGVSSLSGYWSKEGLRRALENLLSNAIKYGESGSPIALRFESDGKTARISVHNRGNPIPEQDLRCLFKLYHRTRSAEKSDRKGWGLGLVLVKAVAEAHGGRIEVESAGSTGTRFTLVLPISVGSGARA